MSTCNRCYGQCDVGYEFFNGYICSSCRRNEQQKKDMEEMLRKNREREHLSDWCDYEIQRLDEKIQKINEERQELKKLDETSPSQKHDMLNKLRKVIEDINWNRTHPECCIFPEKVISHLQQEKLRLEKLLGPFWLQNL